MHENPMWKISDWNQHVRLNPSVRDLSLQINEYGDIPAECGKCKKKVRDIETERKKVGKFIEISIYCTGCGWLGTRLMGKR